MKIIQFPELTATFTKGLYETIGDALEDHKSKAAAFLAVTIVKIFDVIELALAPIIFIASLVTFPFAYVLVRCNGHSFTSASNSASIADATLDEKMILYPIISILNALQNIKNIFNVMPYVRIMKGVTDGTD